MKYLKTLGAIFFLFAGFTYWSLYIPISSSSADDNRAADSVAYTFVEIKPNEPFGDITADLHEKKLIRNRQIAEIYARFTGLDTKIKAGRFRLEGGMAPVKVLRFLAHPEYGEVSVTIPEGFSIFDIDEKLAGLDLIKKGEFAAWAADPPLGDVADFVFIKPQAPSPKLEGYLFPDTYLAFARNFRPQDLGRAMLKNFEKKISRGLADDIQKNKRTLGEIIAMASILEKEVRTPEDFAVVSGILWKRMDSGWPLQADATLLYGKQNRSISYEELRADSDYNTYTRLGLPKTPIGNPGLAMIKAALEPAESPYWFYLTSRDGRTIYAATNDEHNRNKQKYL